MDIEKTNPMGTDGFEFIEFTAPEPTLLHDLFKLMGFTAIAKHRRRAVTLYRQNDVNFLLNAEPNSFAADFAAKHGPSACGFAMRVKDAQAAEARAREHGAKPIADKADTAALDAPKIEGIGGSMLYLIDQYGEQSAYTSEFEALDGQGPNARPAGVGLSYIDHLTHNVGKGEMDTWANFYERLFNFEQIRYFDIKGKQTGLTSRAMTSPDGKVRIPLNESADDKSQIAEFLRQYNGEGIQHIALYTDSIYTTIEAMRENGVGFLDTPDTYYAMVNERVPNHGEDLERMQKDRILIDADEETKTRLLLQIFTENVIGPIFFEIIQRKGNEGFGEGNFRALFEAIERDQERRGVL